MKFSLPSGLACLASCMLLYSSDIEAREFNEVFADSTLRLDYIIAGDANGDVSLSLCRMHKSPDWAGRRNNLERLHFKGNGDVTVTSLTGDTLYCNSFSSLFNEWIDLNMPTPTAFEHTVLVPMPKDTVNVSFSVYDKHHRPLQRISHQVVPTDILIGRNTSAKPDTVMLHSGSWPGHRISVAILAEGYTADELPIFIEDAQIVADEILSYEPFNEMRERFDFVAVLTPSKDSGVSVPRFDDWKSSAFSSHFSTFYSDRYLTTPAVFDIHDALSGVSYEHIIILANTEEYGGGGIFNDYTLTTAHHPMMRPVVVHEFGHSFGGLADEYFYNGDVMDDTYPKDAEPWEPNITTLIDFDSKWKHLLPEGTPIPTPDESRDMYPLGVYEGGGYSFQGIYRPAFTCRMRDNYNPTFCEACRDAIRNLIIFYTE